MYVKVGASDELLPARSGLTSQIDLVCYGPHALCTLTAELPSGASYVMTFGRTTTGISKRRTEEDCMRNWGHRRVAASLCDDGGELSRVSWPGPPRGSIGANFGNI